MIQGNKQQIKSMLTFKHVRSKQGAKMITAWRPVQEIVYICPIPSNLTPWKSASCVCVNVKRESKGSKLPRRCLKPACAGVSATNAKLTSLLFTAGSPIFSICLQPSIIFSSHPLPFVPLATKKESDPLSSSSLSNSPAGYNTDPLLIHLSLFSLRCK